MFRVWCPEGYFDPNSSYMFGSEIDVIHSLTDSAVVLTTESLAIFTGLWYAFMCINYGTNVPSGLFLPGVIIGCALGDMIFLWFETYGWMPEEPALRN